MANRTTRRDRRNTEHGYSWVNVEAAHLNRIRARRAREWRRRRNHLTVWQEAAQALAPLAAAMKDMWSRIQRAFRPMIIDADPDDPGTYTLAGTE